MDALKSANAGTTDPAELHLRNIRRTGTSDVMISAYPGSGSALICNVLTELGFDHVDPYSEVLDTDGTATVIPDMLPYRSRLAATAAADAGGHAGRGGLRFVKNHLAPRHFAGVPIGGAVLLVRDPRDAVYSTYRFFNKFSRFWWPDTARDKGQGTFAEFLNGVGVNDEPPIDGWVGFYRAWYYLLPALPRHAVVRFEDLKTDPVRVVAGMLRSLGVPRPEPSIVRAVERSGYETMRAHEEQVVGDDQPMILRRGKVNEWHEWFDDSPLADRFLRPDMAEVAALFGYRIARAGDRS